MNLKINIKQMLKNEKLIGSILFFISFCLGIATIFMGIFEDEADNLVTGAFLSQGKILYQDIFTHHFPFPYFWMAFIVAFFGKSLFFSRLSIVLYQIISLGWAAKLTKKYIPIAITSLIWSVLRVMYLGNMVLYNSFCAIAVVVIFILVLHTFVQKIQFDKFSIGTIVLFSSIAVLSDPLAIYPIFIGIIFILFYQFKAGIKIVTFGLGVAGLFVLYLLISHSLSDFYHQAIIFNTTIYSKYVYSNPNRFHNLWNYAKSGLGLFNSAWWNFNIFKTITFNYTDFDQWFFSGGIYRISSLGFVLIGVFNKKFFSAAFVYLFLSAALVINPWGFRGQTFVLLTVYVIALFISLDIWKDKKCKIGYIFSLLFLIILGWNLLRVARGLLVNYDSFNYKNKFSYIFDLKNELELLACDQDNVMLGYYPSSLYLYWYTEYEPISKYTYLWPWVAEIALDDLINELNQPGMKAFVIRNNMLVWDHFDTKVYMKKLDDFLDENYINDDPSLYVSPFLERSCKAKE